jgi:methylase of polypeptide subunit release factors
MKGCQVVAIDKYDAAAVCARANAARNNVASLVDVRVGDCLAPLTEVELFDLAIASPPLLPGQPSGGIEAALLDSGLSGTLRFIEDVGDHLLPGGSALLMLSDVFFRLGHNLHQLSSSAGLVSRAIRERKMSYEIYTVFELRRGEDGQL